MGYNPKSLLLSVHFAPSTLPSPLWLLVCFEVSMDVGVTTPILEMGKARLREAEPAGQRDLNPRLLTAAAGSYTPGLPVSRWRRGRLNFQGPLANSEHPMPLWRGPLQMGRHTICPRLGHS